MMKSSGLAEEETGTDYHLIIIYKMCLKKDMKNMNYL